MVYYLKKGKNTTETQKKICAVYEDSAVTDQTCQKSFLKFCAGDFSLDDAPLLSGPAEVDSDRMEPLTENSQRYTTRETANIRKISKSIKLLVKMKNVPYFMEKNVMDFVANPMF